MSTLNLGKNVTLEIGDFIVVAWGNHLEYGWYCGQGAYKSTLQYYNIYSPGSSFEEFEKYERGEEVQDWIAERFKKQKGFTSKCFYKNYINSFDASRIMKPADPDNFFTNPEDIEAYNKSKEALIRIKFLNK